MKFNFRSLVAFLYIKDFRFYDRCSSSYRMKCLFVYLKTISSRATESVQKKSKYSNNKKYFFFYIGSL